MKHRHILWTLPGLLGLIIVHGMLTSCISDAISTSPHDVLTFSRDTVSFDTVFTGVGTPTARLIVSNKAKKGIKISSIRFKDPDTRFRLNVDGQSGSEFSDIEIMARDSIYVFIECNIPESAGAEPSLTEDKLEFVTNTVTQDVVCQAWGQNVTRLRGVTIEENTRFTAERPYVIFDSLKVAAGATLTVDPGAKLLFHDKALMTVDGTLHAIGTPDKKIDMRGDRLDNVLPDVEYDIMSGQWRGVNITAESYDNRLEYVDMRSTEVGLVLDSCANSDRTKLTMLNSWLHNSRHNVLQAQNAKINATGCVFSEAAGATVLLSGGDVNFLQCTFANNYLFTAISLPLVTLVHVLPDEENDTDKTSPLMKARFDNCILYGIPDDLNIGDFTGADVLFRYCSFKSKGENDDNFTDCLWDTDPMFRTIREEYYFNYRLQDDSPVKSAGDPALLTPASMTDMDGVNRLQYGNPSLGAYQYVPAPENP